MRLSLVIPLFNESARIGILEDGLTEFARGSPWPFEIVLVDDGSTDETASMIGELVARLTAASFLQLDGARVVTLPENLGKGAALRAGVMAARGEWILTLDADMATPPRQLLEWAEKGLVGLESAGAGAGTIFIGSREHPDSVISDRPGRRFAGRCFNFLLQTVNGLYLGDTQCGFKLYPAAAARTCFERSSVAGWAHDVEVLAHARDAGLRIVSLPIVWRFVDSSKVSVIRDCWRMALDLLRVESSRLVRILSGAGAGDAYDRMSVALLVTLPAIILLTFRDYGVSFDDIFQKEYGEAVYAYYSSRFRDLAALSYRDVFHYGGLYDVLATVAAKRLPFGDYESRHLFNALVGLSAMLGVWKLGRLLGGPRGGFWSLLLLVLSSGFYGHMFNNPKDVPFAAGHVWALYFLVVAFEHLPAVPKGLVPKLALAIGATAGVRVGGALVACYFVAAFVLFASARAAFRSSRRDALRGLPKAAVSTALTLSLAFLVMLAGWPWAQQKPFSRPLEALEKMTHFHWQGDVLFRGGMVKGTDLPWDYIPGYMAVKLPELTLFGLGLAAFLCVWQILRRRVNGASAARFGLMVVAAVFPVAYAIHRKSIVYDEMRHFLFVVPVLSCIAGVAIAGAVDRLGDVVRMAKPVALAILAAWAVYQLSVMVRLHPHQYVYYNRLAGGVAGADGKYEIDYWANSYKEAVRGLERFLDPEPRRPGERNAWKVNVCGPDHSARYYFPKNFVFTTRASEADFFISYTRQRCHESVKGKTVFAARRFTVPLSVVKDLRKER